MEITTLLKKAEIKKELGDLSAYKQLLEEAVSRGSKEGQFLLAGFMLTQGASIQEADKIAYS